MSIDPESYPPVVPADLMGGGVIIRFRRCAKTGAERFTLARVIALPVARDVGDPAREFMGKFLLEDVLTRHRRSVSPATLMRPSFRMYVAPAGAGEKKGDEPIPFVPTKALNLDNYGPCLTGIEGLVVVPVDGPTVPAQLSLEDSFDARVRRAVAEQVAGIVRQTLAEAGIGKPVAA